MGIGFEYRDYLSGDNCNYVAVQVTADSATENGERLIEAYAKAKTLTPNGAALSATNRACVIVPPGKYDLDHGTAGACVPLILDTEFVDIIGLTTDRSLQHIYGTPAATNSGVIVQTANDVHISNLTVEILTALGTPNWDNTDSAAYFPSTNLNNTVVDNCNFIGDDGSGTILFSMRIHEVEYSGTFNYCRGDAGSFGSGHGSIASGTFTNCTGSLSSFGTDGVACGIFTNCIGGDCSFGCNGVASGTFTNCDCFLRAFGSEGIASGTLNFCKISGYALPSPVASVATVEIASGGTNYEVDDELTVSGGTGTAATLKVTSVAGGVIDGISILTVGAYTAEPSNPVATTGHTANATFNLTWNEGHIYGCVDSTGFIAEQNWND